MNKYNQCLEVCSDSGKPDEDLKLLKPLIHLMHLPGSKMLNRMLVSFNYWLKVPNQVLRKIEHISAMAINASLLVDDIEDNSPVRRSNPAAHTIYGTPLTLNAGTYTCFIVLEKCMSLGNPQAYKMFLNGFLEANRGQGMDIYWREYSRCPTEEEYCQNVKKIDALVFIGVDLLKLFSDYKGDLTKLSYLLTLYHRLRNDYMNLWSADYQSIKSVSYEDITEGKFSFPIIHGIKNSPKSEDILQILKKKTTDVNLKKYCVSLIEEAGSHLYTLEKMKEIYKDILCEIEALGGNPDMEDLVKTTLKLRE